MRLHILFRDADTLGCLIDPKRAVEITDPTGLQSSFEDVDWDDIAPLLDKAADPRNQRPRHRRPRAPTPPASPEPPTTSATPTRLIATNVPYLSRSNHETGLRTSLTDLSGGQTRPVHDDASASSEHYWSSSSRVLPQGWLFLSRYEALRERLLQLWSLAVLACLGAGAFDADLW